jgi:general secretion pathway protein G
LILWKRFHKIRWADKYLNKESFIMSIVQKKDGFTIFEIVIALAIIGGLMAVIIPRITRQQEQAQRKQAQQAMKSIKESLTLYKVDMGKYPKSAEGGLQRLITAPTPRGNWNGPYLGEIPTDAWGNEIEYYSPARDKASGAYELVSPGDLQADDPEEFVVGSK